MGQCTMPGTTKTANSRSRLRCRPAMAERRAHRRAPFAAPVLLDAEQCHDRGWCLNLSAGGVVAATTAGFLEGTDLDVYFELPQGVAVETRARVTRSWPGHVVLAFVALSVEQRRAIRAYCLRPDADNAQLSA